MIVDTHSYMLSPFGPALQLQGGSKLMSASSFCIRFALDDKFCPFMFSLTMLECLPFKGKISNCKFQTSSLALAATGENTSIILKVILSDMLLLYL